MPKPLRDSIATDLQPFGNDFVTQQSMSQLTSDLRFCRTLLELSSGGFDRVSDLHSQFAQAFAFERIQRLTEFVQVGGNVAGPSKSAVTGDVSPATQIFHEHVRRFVPGPFLQLKSKPRQRPFKELPRVDVVREQDAGIGHQEERSGTFRRTAPSEVCSASEPRHVAGLLQQQPRVAVHFEKLRNLLVFLIDIGHSFRAEDRQLPGRLKRWRFDQNWHEWFPRELLSGRWDAVEKIPADSGDR